MDLYGCGDVRSSYRKQGNTPAPGKKRARSVLWGCLPSSGDPKFGLFSPDVKAYKAKRLDRSQSNPWLFKSATWIYLQGVGELGKARFVFVVLPLVLLVADMFVPIVL